MPLYSPSQVWVRRYFLDWTAQANLTITGTHTIDNHSWTAENTGTTTQFAIVNGTGLIIKLDTSGTGNYGDNVRTAPLFRALLNDLLPTANPLSFNSLGYRIWSRVILTNAVQNFQFASSGVEWSNKPVGNHSRAARGFNGTGIGVQNSVTSTDFTTSTTLRDTFTISSDDVLMLVWTMPFNFEYFSGAFTNAWPPPTMTPRSSMNGVISSAADNPSANTGTGAAGRASSTPRVVLVTQPTGATSANFSATFTHLQVDELISV